MKNESQTQNSGSSDLNWEILRERRMFQTDVRRAAPLATNEAIEAALTTSRLIHGISATRELLLACTLRRLIPSL